MAKKPKKVNFDLIAREDAADLYATLDDLVAKHHDHLSDANIQLAWRIGWKGDADGRMKLGQCKKATDLDRLLHELDFVILLNQEAWRSFTEEQRTALLDHELCHAEVSRDEDTGEPKIDENGRIVYRVRKHDLEEFRAVVERHGIWKRDLASFADAVRKAKKIPLFGEVADDPEVRAAVEKLRPKKGDGIDSITIEGAGESVTLEAR